MNPMITPSWIDDIVRACHWQTFVAFDRCAVVVCELPNGFILSESSSVESPAAFSQELAIAICSDRIINKIWELEGYRLSSVSEAANA